MGIPEVKNTIFSQSVAQTLSDDDDIEICEVVDETGEATQR
jgi:hypothetical protein